MGALLTQSKGAGRNFDISVRVGTPKLDNYHHIRGSNARFTSGVVIPIEDGADAVKRKLWLETDRAWRAAGQRLIQIRTDQQVKLAGEDDSDDFSAAPAEKFIEVPAKIKFNSAEWAARLRKLSAGFAKYPAVLNSSVTVLVRREIRYFVNTEGARIQQGRTLAQVIVNAQAKAADGMDLRLGETVEAAEPGQLPSEDALRKVIDKIGTDLSGLLRARWWIPMSDRRFFPATPRACSSTRFSATGSRATARRTKPKARPSPRAWASRCCRTS